uniref:CCHC-type domain-containing protein n=1 Tax=Globodera rostochiensis TaxID=31243 RepID=A0A914GX00_GLORO
MSAHFRAQITQAHGEATDLLADQRVFPVPARPAGQPDTAFRQTVHSVLKTLNAEITDVSAVLTDIVCASDRWMSLRTSMTGAERGHDNPIYDAFVVDTPYLETTAALRKYLRNLRDQSHLLESALPLPASLPTAPAPSLIHLPKTTLPVFSGDCTAYIKAGVHDLNISDSLKFTYLKQCLTGPPLTLINSLPVTDESYLAALGLLSQHYDNPEEVARALHNSLRKLPRVRGGETFCADLRGLVDQIESICIQMSQQNCSYDTVAVQMEVEERLPRFVLDEVFMAKEADEEWSTDKLKARLRAILKREGNKLKPNLPCLFCEDPNHYSATCKKFPDLPSRTARLRGLNRCFKCMKEGHQSRQCPYPARCTGCHGPHPRALCPHHATAGQSTHFVQSPMPQPSPSFGAPSLQGARPNPLPARFPPSLYHTPALSGRPPLAVRTRFPSHPPDLTDPTQPNQTNTAITAVAHDPSLPILLKCINVTFLNLLDPTQFRKGIALLDDASTHSYINLAEAQTLHLPLTPSSVRIGVFNSPQSKDIPQSYGTRFGLQLVDGRIVPVSANGRYQVELPFRTDPATLTLPSNFGLCWGRLRSVLHTLSKDAPLRQKYDKIIREQQNLGIIEIVENTRPTSRPLHYLAHHPVVNPVKNKVRIVYDGSAHLANQPSLNECLYPGPIILPDLVGLLMRFRIPPIAIICDIEKAFLQVSVLPAHRDCTRFLWVRDPSRPLSADNLLIFRFTRVAFGLTCSPFLLAATIRHHLARSPSPLSQEIAPNIYVDNLFLSASTPSEGQGKTADTMALFELAQMPLREFACNDPTVLANLPADRVLPGQNQKFLGIGWDTDSDRLSFSPAPPPPSFSPTKRSVLSFVASHYDPLGLISPAILPLKVFLQSLSHEELGWDQALPADLGEKWDGIMKNWAPDKAVTIPRCPLTLPQSDRTYQLHCFSDSSSFAMCATVFLRVSHPDLEQAECFLIFAKTKVKPMHKGSPLTIPKLELISAEMGARALKFVQPQLSSLNLSEISHLWSDSAIVLAWLQDDAKPKEIFVRNRLNVIKATPNLIVRHLPGDQNPADIGSRGVPAVSSLNTTPLWWSGPPWLPYPPDRWPNNPEIRGFSTGSAEPGHPPEPSPPPFYPTCLPGGPAGNTVNPLIQIFAPAEGHSHHVLRSPLPRTD